MNSLRSFAMVARRAMPTVHVAAPAAHAAYHHLLVFWPKNKGLYMSYCLMFLLTIV